MLEKNAAKQVVDLIQEIQARMDKISTIYNDHGGEEDRDSYNSTSEFVTGYLHQDVMHPLLVDYPDLAPSNWKRNGNGQWMRIAGN